MVSPRESHQSEETLPTVPLGQFQAQRSDNTTTKSIAHSQTDTPSQSEINSTITENIVENIVTFQTDTPSQREIFSETGTGTSSSEDVTHSDGDTPEEHPQPTGTQSANEETSESSGTATSSQSEIFSSYNNIYVMPARIAGGRLLLEHTDETASSEAAGWPAQNLTMKTLLQTKWWRQYTGY